MSVATLKFQIINTPALEWINGPETDFLMKALGLQPHVFICFSVFEPMMKRALAIMKQNLVQSAVDCNSITNIQILAYTKVWIMLYIPCQMWCQVNFNSTSVQSQFPSAGKKN